MIRWILMDQAGVQVRMFPTKNNYIINNQKYSGKELAKIYTHPLYEKYMLGMTSEKNLVSTFIKESGLDLLADDFVSFFKNEVELIPGMFEIISSLKERYSLAALVNEGKEWSRNKFKKSKLEGLFDWIFISGEIGLRKPENRFYRFVLKSIKAEANECLFIDDLKRNCEGAEAIGIPSIHFKTPDQLRKKLISYI